MNPAEARNQFTIYNADQTLSIDIPAGNLDEIRNIGRMLFAYAPKSAIKVILLKDGTEVTNDKMLQKFAEKVMSLPLQLIPQQVELNSDSRFQSTKNMAKIFYLLYNADKTSARIFMGGTLEGIINLGKKEFHYSDCKSVKVVLEKDGTEIKDNEMMKNVLSNFGYLSLQLIPQYDRGGNVADVAVGAAASVGTATGAALGAPAAISAIGFTANGVAAGSMAAAWQASIGNVAAGSMFATLQSVGAAGLGATGIGLIAVAGAGIGFGLGFGAYKLGKLIYDKVNEEENNSSKSKL